MKNLTRTLLLCALLSWFGIASATVVTFNFGIGSNTGYGWLDLSSQGSGDFLATAGELTVTGSSSGNLAVGTFSLVPGGPGVTLLPFNSSWAWAYDNVVDPTSNPVVSWYGLLFSANGYDVNIFSTANSTPGQYSFGVSYNGALVIDDENIAGTFNVPEPTSIALLGLGLIGLGLIGRKQQRQK